MKRKTRPNENRALLSLFALVGGMLAILLLLPRPPSGNAAAVGHTVSAISNVRLFDGDQVVESATLLFGDGQVIAAGRDIEIPAAAEVIDGSGHTLLPGLIDSHVHVFGSARADALRFGVTTVLDMFAMPTLLPEALRQRENLNETTQADLFSAGFLATVEGGHGTQFGLPVPTLSHAQEADAWVAERIAEGSDYIKIIIEDGSSWGRPLPTLDAETIQALTHAAHAQGVMAVAHVSTMAGAEIALDAGVDGLVHLFADQPIDQDWLARAAEAGLWVAPTTTVLAGAYGQSGAGWLNDHAVLGPRLNATQRQSLDASFSGSDLRIARWPLVMRNLAALHEVGIPILAGSDAPNPGTAHGASLWHELKLLMDAGLTPIQAFSSATRIPAQAFGLEDRGCLKPGCRADMVLIRGNPLQQSDTTDHTIGSVLSVWKNGHAVALDPATEPVAESNVSTEVAEPRDLLSDVNRWMVSTDQFMGGNSIAEQFWADGRLEIRGELRNGSAFPYAGTMWMTSNTPMQAVDFSGHRQLMLNVSGDQARYRVMLFSGEQVNGMPIMRDFSADALLNGVTLNLNELPGLDLSRLRAIGVFAADRPGALEFTIEQARLH